MTETQKKVPAKRHDPEMENLVYEGGQSQRAKGRRPKVGSDHNAPEPRETRDTRANGQQ